MTAGGESLDTIIIGDGLYDEVRNGKDVVIDFHAACPNVCSLSVVGEDDTWASAFGEKLEELQVSGHRSAVEFPKCGTSSLELNFTYHRKHDFERIHLKISGLDWQKSGREWKSFTVSGCKFSEAELKTIRENRRTIEHIDVDAYPNDNGKVADFLASYGDQLELVDVRQTHESQLNRAVGACRA